MPQNPYQNYSQYDSVDAFKGLSLTNYSQRGYNNSNANPKRDQAAYYYNSSYPPPQTEPDYYVNGQNYETHNTSTEYYNPNSRIIVETCSHLVATILDKHNLKSDICRYLDSISLPTTLSINEAVELICLIQQEMVENRALLILFNRRFAFI